MIDIHVIAMILTIPYQTLEIGRIHINTFQKDGKGRSIAPLSYKDTAIDMNDLSILTPPLKVLDYNIDTSRIRFDIKDQKPFGIKLNTLQKYLESTFYLHRMSFLNKDFTISEIENIFQHLLLDDVFSVFIYPTTSIYKEDGSVIKMSTIQPGDSIRFTLCIQGVVIIDTYGNTNSNTNSNSHLRVRIQHYVPAVWHVNTVLPTNTGDSKASKCET